MGEGYASSLICEIRFMNLYQCMHIYVCLYVDKQLMVC